jgi:hypothetical protein
LQFFLIVTPEHPSVRLLLAEKHVDIIRSDSGRKSFGTGILKEAQSTNLAASSISRSKGPDIPSTTFHSDIRTVVEWQRQHPARLAMTERKPLSAPFGLWVRPSAKV